MRSSNVFCTYCNKTRTISPEDEDKDDEEAAIRDRRGDVDRESA